MIGFSLQSRSLFRRIYLCLSIGSISVLVLAAIGVLIIVLVQSRSPFFLYLMVYDNIILFYQFRFLILS